MDTAINTVIAPVAYLGHFALFLLVLSMLMGNLKLLRVLAIASGLLMIFYSAFVLGDIAGIFWGSALVCANLFQLAWVAFRNWRMVFTRDEQAFYLGAVPDLTPVDVRKFLNAGTWTDVVTGTYLARQGEPNRELVFITMGHVNIETDGQVVAACGPGDFIGEVSFATNDPATASAVTASPVRYIGFDPAALSRLLERYPHMRAALELGFRHNIRDKLVQANRDARLAQARAVAERPSRQTGGPD